MLVYQRVTQFQNKNEASAAAWCLHCVYSPATSSVQRLFPCDQIIQQLVVGHPASPLPGPRVVFLGQVGKN